MDFEKPTNFSTNDHTIYCVPKQTAIAKPQTWNIPNGVGDLEGKHLLVFHLLPQEATRKYAGGLFNGTLNGPRPKCDLFIRFVSFSIFQKYN